MEYKEVERKLTLEKLASLNLTYNENRHQQIISKFLKQANSFASHSC